MKIVSFVLVFVLTTLLLSAQESGWENTQQIQSRLPHEIINNPDLAAQHWDTLTTQQRELVYLDDTGLQTFSDQFASQQGIDSLDLGAGSASYDGTYLVNGATRLPLANLINAKVTSLEGGGFSVEFPDGTDLSTIPAQYTSGLSVTGNQILLRSGTLTTGRITLQQNSMLIQGGSEFTQNGIRMRPTQDVTLYNRRFGPDEDNTILFSGGFLQVRGNDIEIEFADDHDVNEVIVDGRITLRKGADFATYDGTGGVSWSLPLTQIFGTMSITDRNAPLRTLQLDAENNEINWFASCPTGVTGAVITDVTGHSVGTACGNNLRPVGVNARYIFFSHAYTAELAMDNDQSQQVTEAFRAMYGRDPVPSNPNDVAQLGQLVNQHVDTMRLSIVQKKSITADKKKMSDLYGGWLQLAGVSAQQPALDAVFEDIHGKELQPETVFMFELDSGQGKVTIVPTQGEKTEYSIPGDVARGILRNYYDSINTVNGQAADLLKGLAIQKVASN